MFFSGVPRHAVFLVILFFLKTNAVLMPTTDNRKILKERKEVAEIFDIKVNVTLYNKRIPQLEVEWMDNLPSSTSYNVIVKAENPTKCPEMPCSVYGIPKLKMKERLLIPESPMSFLDVMECSYMLGCSYMLTVETSNVDVSKSKKFLIPKCILDVCSCQHASTLPKVQLDANMPRNDTINIKWSIKWNEGDGQNLTKQQLVEKFNAMMTYNIYLKVNKQTNPSLSWGGKLIPVAENVYSLKNMSYISTDNKLYGKVNLKTNQEITSNSVLSVHSYIEDDLHCLGPPNLVKIKVPVFNEPDMELINKDFETQNSVWIIGIVVFVCTGASALLFFIWRRTNQLRIVADMKKDENVILPFNEGIEMEDNINYVDKYIEEAQAKGLADGLEVPHSTVELQEEIGEGAFGRVYRGFAMNLRRMRGATVVAVKQLKRNQTSDEIREFLAEIEMLKGVGTHKNIVCILGCCTIRPPYLMIMEYVGRGNLLTYLRTVRQYASKVKSNSKSNSGCSQEKNAQAVPVKYIDLKLSTQSAYMLDSAMEIERQPKPSLVETTYTIIDEESQFEYILDNKELHNFALQIANGIRFLEEKEITHRDLAARNVLIDERKTLKISDFGLSRHGIYTNTKPRKLPLRWLSIEAIRDNVYSNKSDVWAYGVVLWEIGTLGASPYPSISNHELIPFLISGQRLEKPEICTQQVYDIMLQCWNADPEKRPTFEELFRILSPKTAYVDINELTEDYVFPPIQNKLDTNI